MNSPIEPAIIVLIPAYMEEARVADTVSAARALPGVTRVLVIDDGSADATAQRAAEAGAEVIRQPRNGGKGAALRAGLASCPGERDDIFLLLDADLGPTAAEAAQLLPPVVDGTADLTIARFPKAAGKAGFGLVKGLARWGSWFFTRQWLEAPISGQRACRRWVLEAAPIADGYGVEVAMNIAAGDAGARIVEVPVSMTHNATGRTLSGFHHRGRQFVHIIGALCAALLGNTGECVLGAPRPLRLALWLAASVMVLWWLRVAAPHFPVSQTTLLGFSVLTAALGPLCAAVGSGLFRARKVNFRQRFIPALGGLLLLPVLLLALHLDRDRLRSGGAVLLVVLFFGWMLLGMLDDVKGDAVRKGFRGHLTALLRGQLTTGGMKLLGGGVLSLLMAGMIIHLLGAPWWSLPITALLIALSANAMNLFDLRPGRALKVFWLVAFPLAALLPRLATGEEVAILPLTLLITLLATLWFAPFDLSGMMMLGDTGANPLGALLGVGLACALPWPGQLLAVILLVALHGYAERASITRTIERVRWLRWLDQLGR